MQDDWKPWPPPDELDCIEVELEFKTIDRALRVDPKEHNGEKWLIIENIKRKKKLKPLRWRRIQGRYIPAIAPNPKR